MQFQEDLQTHPLQPRGDPRQEPRAGPGRRMEGESGAWAVPSPPRPRRAASAGAPLHLPAVPAWERASKAPGTKPRLPGKIGPRPRTGTPDEGSPDRWPRPAPRESRDSAHPEAPRRPRGATEDAGLPSAPLPQPGLALRSSPLPQTQRPTLARSPLTSRAAAAAAAAAAATTRSRETSLRPELYPPPA